MHKLLDRLGGDQAVGYVVAEESYVLQTLCGDAPSTPAWWSSCHSIFLSSNHLGPARHMQLLYSTMAM